MTSHGSRLPDGTVGVVLADLAGSTKLWQDAPEAMAATMAELVALVDDTAVAHNGVRPAEQGEGDSFVAAFARVSDAVAFALDVQLATRARAWPGDLAPRLRTSVHAGEVDVRDETFYVGSTMNRAGRLRSLAAGGQTLLSGAAVDLSADRLPAGAEMRDLGTHRLRDLTRAERIFELRHTEINEDFPSLRSLDAVANNLPAQLTSFVGREDELRQVGALVTTHRLVTVTGPGGGGKTRLSLHVAAEMTEHFADGAWFVDLSENTTGAAVGQAVADAMRISDTGSRAILDVVASRLENQDVLVLLDNCEHVVHDAATVADHLLRACPGVTILATSREPLGVDGEITWRIPTMTLPGDDEVGAALAASDAVRLFIDRAITIRPNFSVTNDNAPSVVKICQRLEGIPLAIELAAARVRVLSPEQIAAGLDDRFRLLGAGPRTALPRQATLTASVDWSVDLLGDDERRLLTRLSVFVGAFDLDAAEAVCGAAPLRPAQVLDLLDALVQKSLVVADDDGASVRYRLLETIRQYAAAKLNGDETAVREAHLDWYVRLAEALHSARDDIGHRLEHVATNYPNLCAAIDYAVAARDVEAGLRLVAGLSVFWIERAMTNEGLRRVEAVLALDGGDPSRRARALWAESELVGYSGDFPAAVARAAAARRIAAEVGDAATEAMAIGVIASCSAYTSTAEQTDAFATESLALLARVEEPFASAHVRFFAAMALDNVGRQSEAVTCLRECLEIHRRTGCYNAYAAAAGLVSPQTHLGLLDAAIADAAAALELVRVAASPYVESHLLARVSMTYAYRGDVAAARAALEQSREIAAAHQDMQALAVHMVLANITLAAIGDVEALRANASATIATFDAMGLPQLAVTGKIALADALLREGDATGAVAVIDSIPPAGDMSTILGRQFFHVIAARTHRATTEYNRAFDQVHAALELDLHTTFVPILPSALDTLACLLVDVAQDADAVRLFSAAQRVREEINGAPWPLHEPERVAATEAARARMGEDAFDAAWKEGAQLDREAAVAYARRGRGERKRPALGWDSLTPAELDVARLVAEGLSNGAIGERLFVSVNTVRTHLRNIFAKVDVASRTELAVALRERGEHR